MMFELRSGGCRAKGRREMFQGEGTSWTMGLWLGESRGRIGGDRARETAGPGLCVHWSEGEGVYTSIAFTKPVSNPNYFIACFSLTQHYIMNNFPCHYKH